MTIKYVPTTVAVKTDEETQVVLSDGEYMLYEMLKELINAMKKRPRG